MASVPLDELFIKEHDAVFACIWILLVLECLDLPLSFSPLSHTAPEVELIAAILTTQAKQTGLHSPVPLGSYPTLATLLLLSGLASTAAFFV